jgi:hypothetical protein
MGRAGRGWKELGIPGVTHGSQALPKSNQIAALLKTNIFTVRTLVRQGRLKHVEIGHAHLIPHWMIENFLHKPPAKPAVTNVRQGCVVHKVDRNRSEGNDIRALRVILPKSNIVEELR